METSDLEILFRLTPLETYEQWNRERSVSWFELTRGEYAVRVGEQHVFEVEDECDRGWVQYPVVRLWEDVLDVLPDVLSPSRPSSPAGSIPTRSGTAGTSAQEA